MNNSLTTVIGDNWHPKLLPYFAMCLMALMLITNVLNLKVLDIQGYTILSSSLTYVFSLVLTDIITEVYGYRRVRRLVLSGCRAWRSMRCACRWRCICPRRRTINRSRPLPRCSARRRGW